MRRLKYPIRKLICLTFFLIFNFVNAFSTIAQEITIKEEFDKLSLSVELNKKEYVPLEPMFVRLNVSNETDEPLSLLSIPDFKRLMVEITHNGTSKIHGTLFTLCPGRGSLPLTVKKGQTFSESVVLEFRLSDIFPEYGQYKVRFILHNGRSEEIDRRIVSDIKEIIIKEPTGIDRKAVEFLFGNLDPSAHYALFWWKDQNKGENLLETFVEQYGQSRIGEYAIYQLGISYKNGGELEKAEAEFEKVKNSNNKYIADNANKSLAEIEQRKADLQKAQQQKQNQLQ